MPQHCCIAPLPRTHLSLPASDYTRLCVVDSAPPSGPAQVRLADLHLKPAEGALYERLFRECDPSGSQLVTGSAVKGLFSRSKLNNKILAGVWTLADKGKRKALDMENWSAHSTTTRAAHTLTRCAVNV